MEPFQYHHDPICAIHEAIARFGAYLRTQSLDYGLRIKDARSKCGVESVMDMKGQWRELLIGDSVVDDVGRLLFNKT